MASYQSMLLIFLVMHATFPGIHATDYKMPTPSDLTTKAIFIRPDMFPTRVVCATHCVLPCLLIEMSVAWCDPVDSSEGHHHACECAERHSQGLFQRS